MMDAGHIKIYSISDTSENGGMPVPTSTLVSEWDFAELKAGVNRMYLAKGVNEQIDLFVRIWRDPLVRIGMIALISDSEYNGQYRIDNVENSMIQTSTSYGYNSINSHGLKTTDLTLSKLETNYDISIEQNQNSSDGD